MNTSAALGLDGGVILRKELRAIGFTFLGLFFSTGSAVAQANAELNAWSRPLAERQPLVVGASADGYPYSYYNERGEPAGFAADILDAVAQVMKLRVQRVAHPGIDLYARFRNGEFDLLQLFSQTAEREAYTEFSVPLLTLQGALFVRRDGPVKSIEDFNRGEFAIIGVGSHGAKFIRDRGLTPRLRHVSSSAEALRLVDSGECVGTFVTQLTALSIIRQTGLKQVVMFGEPMDGYDVRHCFAVHRGDAQLLARLNEGLAILHDNGEFDRIYRKWFGRVDGNLFTREEVVTYVAAALALGCVAAIWGLWRQRTLRRRIQQLNAELEQRVAVRTAELHARVVEVEQLNQELEAFSSSASHDLRAPLRNITGFLELLTRRMEGKLDGEANRYVATVTRETRRMGALIDDLLAFSRVGRTAMNVGRVDITALVAEVRADLQPEIGARAIEWKIGVLPALEGDRALLRQVLFNLLGNAVKFTRRRDPAVIELGARPAVTDDENWVTIFIRDNGAGFDPKYQDKLFGVFQRLHAPRDFEGTGIGLANVKRIIIRHGGRVWAEGAIDQGATFYFSVPVVFSPRHVPAADQPAKQ